jgi:hypothetical protein
MLNVKEIIENQGVEPPPRRPNCSAEDFSHWLQWIAPRPQRAGAGGPDSAGAQKPCACVMIEHNLHVALHSPVVRQKTATPCCLGSTLKLFQEWTTSKNARAHKGTPLDPKSSTSLMASIKESLL